MLQGIMAIMASKIGSAVSQNLVKWSRQFTNAVWLINNTAVVDNFSGTMAKVSVQTSGGNSMRQNFVSVGGHTYFWSFLAQLPASGAVTDINYSVYDWTHGADIIAPTTYFSLLSTSVVRVTFSFTTPAGCIDTGCYISRDSTSIGDILVGDAWVYDGTNKIYVTTTNAIVP